MWVPEDHLIEPLIDPESAPALALKEDYSLLGCMRPTFFFGNVRATMPNSNPQSCRFHLYSFLPLKLEASAVPVAGATCRTSAHHANTTTDTSGSRAGMGNICPVPLEKSSRHVIPCIGIR
jgi:hypothetical protein